MFYAIKNKRNGKYVTGTDFSCKRQIMTEWKPPLILNNCDGEFSGMITAELKRRGISEKSYKVVPVKIVEVKI